MWYKVLTEGLRIGSCVITITRRGTMIMTSKQKKRGYISTVVGLKKGMKKMNKHPTERQWNRCVWMVPKITMTMNQ